MRKLTSGAVWKCGSFWVLKVLNHNYCLSKSGQTWRKNDNFSFFNFHPTLTANNSGLKPSTLKNYHIFRLRRTSAFLWYPPFRSYSWNTLRKMCFCLSKRLSKNYILGQKYFFSKIEKSAGTKTKVFIDSNGHKFFRTVEKTWKNQTVWSQ